MDASGQTRPLAGFPRGPRRSWAGVAAVLLCAALIGQQIAAPTRDPATHAATTVTQAAARAPASHDPTAVGQDAARAPASHDPTAVSRDAARPASRPAAVRAPAPDGRPVLLAYWAAWGDDTSPLRDLQAHGGRIDWLVPYWYTLRADGSVKRRESNHSAVIRLARRQGARVLLLVNLAANAGSRLADPAFRERAARSIARAVENERADGVHIDFEELPGSLRDDLTAFVASVKAASAGKWLVTIAVGPKWSPDPSLNPAATVYDYRALGRLCDAVVLMTYDLHTSDGAPGPVAPLGWVERVVRYATATIPRHKIIVGLAGYGYDWSPRGGKTVTSRDAGALAGRPGARDRQDPASRETQIRYTDGWGLPHVTWVEGTADAARRAALVRKYGLGGAALWSLGQEDASFWSEVPRALDGPSVEGG